MPVTPDNGFRYYGKLYNTQHGAPAFTYLYDSSVVWQDQAGNLITGGERPATPADFAANISVSGLSLSVGAVALTGTSVVTTTGNQPVNVINTAPLPFSGVVQVGNTVTTNATITNALLAVSGVVQATLDPTAIVLAVSSGNNNTLVADRLLSGISGQNAAIIAGAPLYVTGSFATTSSSSIALTGFSPTLPPLPVSGTFNATTDNTTVILAISSGNASAIIANQLLSGISGSLTNNLSSAAFVTGQVSITNALLAVSGNTTLLNTAPLPVSGVVQANITNAILAVSGNTVVQVTGFNSGIVVTTSPRTSSTTSSAVPSGAAPFTSATFFWGQALAANLNRKKLFLQNIHTGIPLVCAMNGTPASTGNCSFILNPSTVIGYGGSSFSDDGYLGAVQVSGGAWTAWET